MGDGPVQVSSVAKHHTDVAMDHGKERAVMAGEIRAHLQRFEVKGFSRRRVSFSD
jgi:hypothetical protein